MQKNKCGSSSVGRASASQAESRGFEPRFPLPFLSLYMKKAFKYISYNFYFDNNNLSIEYHFQTHFQNNVVNFTPKLTFTIPNNLFNNNLSHQAIDELVFSLGMVEAISYWKTNCIQNFEIACHNLSDKQINWWKDLFFYGLGEFRYINKISSDKEDFILFSPNSRLPLFQKINGTISQENASKVIVPIGGGKDSVVTLEELKTAKQVIPFAINPSITVQNCIETANLSISNSIVVKRQLDPALLELNRLGALNGHTPFSALVAFSTLIGAELTATDFVALSNESSASEATVVSITDDIINHQYSKSYKFESDFRNYYKEHINNRYEYFSYLRPYHELKIAEKFSKYKQYYNIFKSCNVGTKQGNIWCGKCPKCLFVYLMMLPFIPKDELDGIFNHDLLNDMSLYPILLELTGLSEIKPFECVGTIDETKAAIAEYLLTNPATGILREYLTIYDVANIEKDAKKFKEILSYFDTNNFIPYLYI